ncbi:MAG: protein kinase, partial [Oscillospiraceae bacterium]|nr:protein kinase [Oscillospiraceae bacterium]
MAGRAKGSYSPGDTVLGNWKLSHLIGEGGSGKVYEARREDFGRFNCAAVKIFSVPQNLAEEQIDEIDEFSMVANLRESAGMVKYDDREILGGPGGESCDVILRMELLTPFFEYAHSNKLTIRDIIRLGIDICAALEISQKFNIAHKNIKPENIFVSKLGDFMLGDFGISRTAE